MKIDLLLKNGNIFNSYLKKFIHGDIAVVGKEILYVGPSGKDLFEADIVEDLSSRYIIPGLVDSHMHIQSSMMIPRRFSEAVIPHGVTTVISEPHEIANVFGLEGIEASLADVKNCTLDIFLAMPSSVPSTRPDLETTGGVIDIPEIRTMMNLPRTVCLGEVMNVHDVIYEPNCKTNQIICCVRENRPLWPIEGHCPRVTGLELATFIYRGVTSDHTEQALESMKQRLANGVFVQLQGKSLRPELLSYIDQSGLEDRMAFVTDDTMPDDLLEKGHLDQILRTAMAMGYPAEKAIYCATYTPALRMRLFDRGAIAPGKLADLVVLDDVKTFAVNRVYKNGCQVYPARSEKQANPLLPYPEKFYHSVHAAPLSPEDFRIPAPFQEGTVTCRAALIQEHTTMTAPAEAEFPVRNGFIDWESTSYALACVQERHGKGGDKGFLFVGGAVLKEGAAATTYAHDHHNLLILGRTRSDMASAANAVIEKQGGLAVCLGRKRLGFVHLPVAGILSDQPIGILGHEVKTVKEGLKQLGYRHNNIIMSMTTLGLPVSPALKVTDKGIIDVKKMKLAPLIISSTKFK